MIRADDATTVLGNLDFPDQTTAVEAVREYAQSLGMSVSVRYLPSGKVDRVEIGDGMSPPDERPDVVFMLPIPAAQADTLDAMARSMGATKFDVIRWAVNLFKVAFDASAQGQRLAILTQDDEIVQDVIGYGASTTSSASAR